MEFSISEEVVAVRELAAKIFSEQVDDAALKRFDRGEIPWHEGVWSLLGESGLIGVSLPEACGGSGLGLAGLCAVLEEQGRYVTALPLVAASLGALPLVRFGSAAQQDAWLAKAASGDALVVGPLPTSAVEHEPREIPCLTAAGDEVVLNGALEAVPYGADADALLVEQAQRPE